MGQEQKSGAALEQANPEDEFLGRERHKTRGWQGEGRAGGGSRGCVGPTSRDGAAGVSCRTLPAPDSVTRVMTRPPLPSSGPMADAHSTRTAVGSASTRSMNCTQSWSPRSLRIVHRGKGILFDPTRREEEETPASSGLSMICAVLLTPLVSSFPLWLSTQRTFAPAARDASALDHPQTAIPAKQAAALANGY